MDFCLFVRFVAKCSSGANRGFLPNSHIYGAGMNAHLSWNFGLMLDGMVTLQGSEYRRDIAEELVGRVEVRKQFSR